MMTSEWSLSLKVCRIWVGETAAESHEGWYCLKVREIDKRLKEMN